ncbi:MAG: ATP-binding protein [Planctomycetota bacterium]|nr:ATP-binding protein [Planctomycetota bacterium]
MTDLPPDLVMQLQSKPRLLSSVRSMILSLTQRIGFDETECGHIALAIDEALANIIRHGYEERDDEPIHIAVWMLKENPAGIRIMIEDEAEQIDPDSIQGRDLDDVRPGGLGVHIMREIMDFCTFERRKQEKGMRVIMEKHLGEKSLGDSERSRSPQTK